MQACPYGAPDEATQQWFLRDRRLAVDEAVEKLTAYMKWRKEFLPPGGLAWEHVADEAGSGKAYLHTHPDVNGRPVIVVRVSKHITGAAPRAHLHTACLVCCVPKVPCVPVLTAAAWAAQASFPWTAASATARTCWSRRSRSCPRTARPSWAFLTCGASERATRILDL